MSNIRDKLEVLCNLGLTNTDSRTHPVFPATAAATTAPAESPGNHARHAANHAPIAQHLHGHDGQGQRDASCQQDGDASTQRR